MKSSTWKKIACVAATAVIASVSALSLAGCGDKHEHQWVWQHNDTEHWQVCVADDCLKERNRGPHVSEESGKTCDCGLYAKVLGIGYTSGGDHAHASFVREANEWFAQKATELHFTYEASTGYEKINETDIWDYDVIMFFNGTPYTGVGDKLDENGQWIREDDKGNKTNVQKEHVEGIKKWQAFKNYMENGGGWLGFHSAAFAMWEQPKGAEKTVPPNEYEEWYSNEFLGCGEYGGYKRDPSDHGPDDEDGRFPVYWNTWVPTSEPMKIETHKHFATMNLEVEDDVFDSSVCEWYEWLKHDELMNSKNITMLVTMNPTPENPAGHETRKDNPSNGEYYEHQNWYGGCHPIAWANNNYKMVYMNWGHNSLSDYNNYVKSSSTFSSEAQNQIVLDSLFACASKK